MLDLNYLQVGSVDSIHLDLTYVADSGKSLDIAYQAQQFITFVTRWENYNPDINSLHVVHVRK
jgi:Poly(A) polymerase predicted RNA binding domain